MFKLLPWKFILKRAAKSYGVIDPLMVMARIRSFAQPSEVQEPLELLRAGIVFHARGLVNTKAIQHNMDWIWPYWVERQFNPQDPAFIPRGFSFSHINLTHRNWTAVGLPEVPSFPIVDPRGLITPLHDGWSLDFWVLCDDGEQLIPSRSDEARQSLLMEEGLAVRTEVGENGLRLVEHVSLVANGEDKPCLRVRLAATSPKPAFLAVAIRPYNPEGIQFIEQISVSSNEQEFEVNGRSRVCLSQPADRFHMSRYEDGDVYHNLSDDDPTRHMECQVGMATAAALYRLEPGRELELGVDMPLPVSEELADSKTQSARKGGRPLLGWQAATQGLAELRIPDERMQFLYDAAVRTLLLLSADEFYPGPYTYRRFWFRDACLMLKALMVLGCPRRVRHILDGFLPRQTRGGYFASQDGEWDSNGQVLWIMDQYERYTGERLGPAFHESIRKAVKWLRTKRLVEAKDTLHAGLLPAGFSAEHLGPNDYYYWDDFWGVGGLRAAAATMRRAGDSEGAALAQRLGEEFWQAIVASLDGIPDKRCRGAMPASPYRRMDAGAVGSMVADYPLQLFPAGDERVRKTADFLHDHCFQRGGFYQEMIHSGVNAYLTLDMAQTFLRHGDGRYAELVQAVSDLATSTGQWPEAIHPRTLGGCMGDGQHGWAAAEWIMMMRHCFVREELESGQLLLGTGLLPSWLASEQELRFGPTPTPWGDITVRARRRGQTLEMGVEAIWRDSAPSMEARVPGFVRQTIHEPGRMHVLERETS